MAAAARDESLSLRARHGLEEQRVSPLRVPRRARWPAVDAGGQSGIDELAVRCAVAPEHGFPKDFIGRARFHSQLHRLVLTQTFEKPLNAPDFTPACPLQWGMSWANQNARPSEVYARDAPERSRAAPEVLEFGRKKRIEPMRHQEYFVTGFSPGSQPSRWKDM